jgi:chromosome segregation ATPase
MTEQELIDLALVSKELMRLAGAIDKVIDKVKELAERIKTLEENQERLKDAADKAFYAANKLNHRVSHLQCLEPDTDPECPAALSEPAEYRESLHSVSDLEEYSAVTSAAVGAATKAAIEVVRKHRSQAPVEVSWLGWTVKAPLFKFGLLTIIATAFWVLIRKLH